MNLGRRRWAQAAIAVAIGAVTPYLELAWKCRLGHEAS
jgi:hypothetical protein